MSVNEPSSHARGCAFGPYVLDRKRRLLWRDRTPIPLKSRAFDVLAALVENRGRLVSKAEFLELIWPNGIVQESNLPQQISVLRRALDQRPDQHDYIVTVSGRGYQFVADVQDVPCPPDAWLTETTNTGHAEGPVDLLVEAQDQVPSPRAPTSSFEVADSNLLKVHWSVPPLVLGAISLLVVVVLIAIGGLAILKQRSNQELPRPRGLKQLTFESGLPREPTWSPDGQRVAYTSDRDGNTDIWIQSVSSPEPIRLTTSPAKDSQPDWSPDGKWLTFRSERDGGGVYVVPASGGEPRRIADFGYRPRWSPDGALILISRMSVRTGARALYVVAANGGPPRAVLTDLVGEFTNPGAITAAWYPQGRRVSIWGRHPKTGWTFVTAPIDGGPAVTSNIGEQVAQQILAADLTLGNFLWAPSGHSLYFEGTSHKARNAWRISVAPATLAWIAGPERLTTNTGEDGDLALSADGTKLAFTARTSQTRLWSLPFDPSAGLLTGSGGPVTRGGPEELDSDAPADGNKVVYRVVRAGRQELRAHSIVTGQDLLLIAGTNVSRTTPRWSPDGTLLAYQVSQRRPDTGKTDLSVALLSANGGPERLLTLPADTSIVPMDWSRDGTVLLGQCRYRGAQQYGTCVLPLTNGGEDGQIRLITHDAAFNLFCQHFSPNQRWISFLALRADDPALAKVYVVHADGNGWVAMTDGPWYVDKPRWAPDGRTLYYISDRDGFLNVWGRRFDPASGQPLGEPLRVTSFDGEQRAIPARFGQMEMAVTSNQLFLPLRETSGDIWILDNLDK